jgi:hypothetical protein
MGYLSPALRHYIAAATITSDQAGAWFSTEGLSVISATVVMAVGAGTITGEFYAECTADTSASALGPSRVILPAGCLHTSLSGIALADPAEAVAVTAATTGNFTVSLDAIIAGQMRFMWNQTGGTGASPNTITVFLNGRG